MPKVGKEEQQVAKKGKGKTAATPNSNGRKPTGNLPLEEAKAAIMEALESGRKTRTELKDVAPYGNYTKLCSLMEEEGLIVQVDREEGQRQQYELAKPKAKKGKSK